MFPPQKGLVISIVTMETKSGATSNTSITLNDIMPQSMLTNTRTFMSAILNNSIIIIFSQGCLILPHELKEVLADYVPPMKNFSDFDRVNLIISCKGRCPVDSTVITSDDQMFSKNIAFSLSGTKLFLKENVFTNEDILL